jgi:hypothetical protein
MRRSISVHKKRRGRPATGQDPAVTARIPQEVIDRVEAFADAQLEPLTRSEAIGLLIEIGLDSLDRAALEKKPPARSRRKR